jgi:lipoate-protein ligase A
MSDERVKKHPSAACFASSTQADLTSSGFKLIGSAQVWKEHALLQQGSLPLDDQASAFFHLLRYPNAEAREEALQLYQEKTTPLHTFLPQASWEEVAHAFKQGFSTFLHHEITTMEDLTASEWELTQQLVQEKYNQLNWRKERISLV